MPRVRKSWCPCTPAPGRASRARRSPMVRRILLVALAAGMAALAFGQSQAQEGKAWLDANQEPATINVTGLWQGGEWGRISLNQREGGRRIIGTGDGWDISGVVSGNNVYLVLFHKEKIAYTAKLTAESPVLLTGVYASGLLYANSKTRPLRLSK